MRYVPSTQQILTCIGDNYLTVFDLNMTIINNQYFIGFKTKSKSRKSDQALYFENYKQHFSKILQF